MSPVKTPDPIRSPRTLHVTGRVCDEAGAPMAGTVVTLFLQQQGPADQPKAVPTDTSGNYEADVEIAGDMPATDAGWSLQVAAHDRGSDRVASGTYRVSRDGDRVNVPTLFMPAVSVAETAALASDGARRAGRDVIINDPIIDFATPMAGAPASFGGAVNADVDETIDAEFQRLLGRTFDSDDPNASSVLFDQLKRAFKPVPHDDGSLEYEWTPLFTSTGGPAEVDTPVTGEQAVLIERARSGYQDAVRRLHSLEPIIAAVDEQDATAAKLIVIALVDELVDQVTSYVPPNGLRVDLVFVLVATQLDRLADIYGYTDEDADLLDKAEDFTTFLLVKDYIRALKGAWDALKEGGDPGSLGTHIVLVQRGLVSVEDAVREVYRRLDIFGMTLGLRQTNAIAFQQSDLEPMLVQDLLGWAESWVPDARKLAREAGAAGLRVIHQVARTLHALVRDGTYPRGIVSHHAWERPQVRRALQNLSDALDDVIDASELPADLSTTGKRNLPRRRARSA